MKKILAALTTAALMGLSGNALAVPVSPGSPLALEYDFGAPFITSGANIWTIEITVSPYDPFDGGDEAFFEVIDDGTGSTGVIPTPALSPPSSAGTLPYSFIFGSAFILHTGDLIVGMATGSFDIIKVVFTVEDGFGDTLGSEVLLNTVPAPGALALLGFGLIGLGARRRAN